MRKKVYWFTLLSDASVVVFSAIGSLLVFLFSKDLEGAISNTMDAVNNVPSDSVAAGYQVIGGLFAGGVTGMLWLVAMMVCIVLVAVGIYFLIPVISALVINHKIKKETADIYKLVRIDTLIKMIHHGLVIIAFVVWLFNEGNVLVAVIAIGYCAIICILNYLVYKETV